MLTVVTDANGKATFGVHDNRDPQDPFSNYGHTLTMNFIVTMADGTLNPYQDQVTVNWPTA